MRTRFFLSVLAMLLMMMTAVLFVLHKQQIAVLVTSTSTAPSNDQQAPLRRKRRHRREESDSQANDISPDQVRRQSSWRNRRKGAIEPGSQHPAQQGAQSGSHGNRQNRFPHKTIQKTKTQKPHRKGAKVRRTQRQTEDTLTSALAISAISINALDETQVFDFLCET